LTTYETSLGPSHPNVASGLTGLAGVLQLLGRLPECIPLYERAIQIYKAMSDGSPDSDLALTLNDFAVLYFKMRNFPKAEETYVQALDTYESCFGTNHPDVAQALLNLGQFYKATGDAHKAKQYFTRGIETLTSVFGPSHERTLTAVAQAM
jgi:tetratricopeptide (TPR) repeat protein